MAEISDNPSRVNTSALLAEQNRLLYGGLSASVLANAVLALILFLVQWPVAERREAVIWLSLVALVLAWRLVTGIRYRRTGALDKDRAAYWLQRFREGAIAMGLAWGLSALLLFPAGKIEYQVFNGFILAGVSAGAITSLSADRVSALGFVVLSLIPLAVRFFSETGTMPLAMGVMVVLFLAFVTASAQRMQRTLFDNVRLRDTALAKEKALKREKSLNEIIARAQSRFILARDRAEAFDELLNDILQLTESEYGFIGDVLYQEDGTPYLKTYAITNIAWNEQTQKFYDENAPAGMEFFNLDTLFGEALRTGESVIANMPATDWRSGGLPDGHPPLNSFLCLPVHHSDELVALLGIANRPDGYDEELIAFLNPLLVTLGQLVTAARLKQRNADNERRLNRFKHTLDRTLDCVFMFDTEALRFFYVNEGALRQVGYSRDELLTMHPYDIKPDYDEKAFRKLIAPLLQGEKAALTFETIHEHKDGAKIPVEIFLQHIASPDEPGRFVAIVRDISERKRIEKIKREFVATVSHELRTPLTAIAGSIRLLLGGVLGEVSGEAQKMLDIAYSNTQRLTSLVNDLLDMEKLESGKLPLIMRQCALAPIIQQALETNRDYGVERGVTLILEGDIPAVTITVDEQRLLQVISNLVSNAIKFSPDNETVAISVSQKDDNVWIRVTDHGTGIPESFQPYVFEKFAQADSSDTRQKGGTGLGLAISRQLVLDMHGKLGFDSSTQHGTTFWVELPCTTAEVVEAASAD